MVQIVFWTIIIVFLFLYLNGRYFLREGMDLEAPPIYDTTAVREDLQPDRSFATTPINDLDDYEVAQVFQNEGNRKASRATINAAMSRYPLDWVNRPPSDEKFQKYREAFIDASAKEAGQGAGAGIELKNIGGDLMVPPNEDALQAEELKILQTYVPKSANDLTTYSLDDAETLIKKVYNQRGLIPTVEKSNQGSNIFEITEVHKKNEPIQWEEEIPNAKRYELRGEQQIEVPTFVNDLAAGLDPYYEPRTTVRMDRNDYSKWTPGLIRQFAPTYPVKDWY
jgi:hypothetical protein